MAKETDIIDTMTPDDFMEALGIVIEPTRKTNNGVIDAVGDVDEFLSSLGL